MRPYRSDDAPALFAAVRESLDSVGCWLPWCHSGYALADAENWMRRCDDEWRRGEHFAFAVFDEAGFAGGVGLNQRNRAGNFMNLGYWTRRSRQGCGIARRAARRVVEFGFAELGLTRIEVIVEPDNLASRRVAESIGARFEGIARNRILVRGMPMDAAVHAIVPSLAARM